MSQVATNAEETTKSGESGRGLMGPSEATGQVGAVSEQKPG